MGGRRSVEVGRAAERAAAEYLASAGMTLLALNYRARRGEIDIVAREGPTLVFVEVKRRLHHGDALAAVGRAKQRSLMRAALDFLRRSAMLERPVRFDVVSVDGRGRVRAHLRDAFDMTL